jgi:hypothetical protein
MIGGIVIVLLVVLLSAASAFAWLVRQIGSAQFSFCRVALGALGVGGLVLGSRLYLSEGYVSWAPYLDQIAADFTGLLLPLAHGALTWRDVVAANNEHRVILTRLTSLAEVYVNGQWDNRILVVAIFLLQSAIASWICTLSWVFLGWIRGTIVCFAALLPMFLVCDWENMVSGFQTQFMYMVLGSLVAFSLINGRRETSFDRIGSLLIALLVLGTMASGLLTAITLAAASLFFSVISRRGWRSAVFFVLSALTVAAFGWFTRHETPHTPDLYAQDFATWRSAFAAYGAWPLMPNLLGFVLLWLPSIWLLIRTIRRREVPPFVSFVLALGFWVLLQAAALAWSRAGLRGLVSARYTEVLALAFVANAAAGVLLLPSAKSTIRSRVIAYGCLSIWIAGIGFAECWRSHELYRPYLEVFRNQTIEHEQRLGSFMRTGNQGIITSVQFPRIPGGASEIIGSLSDPNVQPLLPGPLRRDLIRDHNPELLPTVKDGPLASAALFLARNGLWIALAGAALLLSAIWYPGTHNDRARADSLQ